MGARTLSKDPIFQQINSRRIVNMIIEQIQRDTQWAMFEVNIMAHFLENATSPLTLWQWYLRLDLDGFLCTSNLIPIIFALSRLGDSADVITGDYDCARDPSIRTPDDAFVLLSRSAAQYIVQNRREVENLNSNPMPTAMSLMLPSFVRLMKRDGREVREVDISPISQTQHDFDVDVLQMWETSWRPCDHYVYLHAAQLGPGIQDMIFDVVHSTQRYSPEVRSPNASRFSKLVTKVGVCNGMGRMGHQYPGFPKISSLWFSS